MTLIRALVVMVVSRWSDYPTLTTGKTLYYQGTDDFSGRSDAVFNFLRGEIEKTYTHNIMCIKGFQNPTTSTTISAQYQ